MIFCGKLSSSDNMIEAAGDRESEIHTDKSKEDISGSACSGEDTRHVSHNLTIHDGQLRAC